MERHFSIRLFIPGQRVSLTRFTLRGVSSSPPVTAKPADSHTTRRDADNERMRKQAEHAAGRAKGLHRVAAAAAERLRAIKRQKKSP
jgi:hypothetical protein